MPERTTAPEPANPSGADYGHRKIPIRFYTYSALPTSTFGEHDICGVWGGWIYVFKQGPSGISIMEEIWDGGNDGIKLVGWKGKTWAAQDERPATVKPATPYCFELDYDPAAYKVWFCLSQVQLSRARLAQYCDPAAGLVPKRCLHFTPDIPEAIPPPEGAGIGLVLTDHLDVAREYQRRYLKALQKLLEYLGDETRALKRFLASLTLDVADQLSRDEPNRWDADVWSWLEGGGKPLMTYLIGEKDLLKNLTAAREAWAAAKATWMETPAFQEVQHDYAGTHDLEVEGLEQQAALLEHTIASRAGRAFLVRALRDEGSWYSRFIRDEKPHFDVAKESAGTGEKVWDFIREVAADLAETRGKQGIQDLHGFVSRRLGVQLSYRVLAEAGAWKGASLPELVQARQPAFLIDVEKVKATIKTSLSRATFALNLVNLLLAEGKLRAEWGKKDNRYEITKAELSLAGAALDVSSTIVQSFGKQMQVTATEIGTIGSLIAFVSAVNEAGENVEKRRWGSAVGFTLQGAGALAGTYGTALGVAEAAGVAEMAGLGAGGMFAATSAALWWTGIGLFLAVAGFVVVTYFYEPPLEEWFKDSSWGVRPKGKSVTVQLQELLAIIGQPGLKVYVRHVQALGWTVALILEPFIAVCQDSTFTVELALIQVTGNRELPYPTKMTRLQKEVEMNPTEQDKRATYLVRAFTAGMVDLKTDATPGSGEAAPGSLMPKSVLTWLAFEGTIRARYVKGMDEVTYEVSGTVAST